MGELVSILIPAYNAERWIRDTMLSAINQTWPEKEVIVVDDGSSDDTVRIAKRLESETVKVITQANTGACGARNNALRYAQGDYIQWLDADDLLHPEKIALQLTRSNGGRESRALLTCAWGKFFFRTHKAKFTPDALWQDLGPVEWIMNKFLHNVWMNPAVWLVSRRLTELAGPWDGRLSLSGDDDGEYICRVVAASEEVKFVPNARCYYRIGTAGSLDWNMGKSRKKLESLMLSLRLSIDHLRSLEDSERTRIACVKHLQTWFPMISEGGSDLADEMNELALKLGGSLRRARTSWKYYPLQLLFGSEMAKRSMNRWRESKLLMRRNWDRVLYQLMDQKSQSHF
jgi:glycosyltransferase involved in cell wall biosynthesis